MVEMDANITGRQPPELACERVKKEWVTPVLEILPVGSAQAGENANSGDEPFSSDS